MCTYHGWTYDLKGALVGVPGFKEVYHEELDRENWGLIRAAQVDTYNGFIFGCMDPMAPTLSEFLGDVGRIGLDLIAAQGDMKVVAGIQKYTIPCNWKLAVDNLFDYYHPGISHASSTMSGYGRQGANASANPAGRSPGAGRLMWDHLVMVGEYGHAIGGPAMTESTEEQMKQLNPDSYNEEWRKTSRAQELLGSTGLKSRGHPNIFPNLWVTESGQLSLRLPKGPLSTEIWWWSFVDHELPEKTQKAKTYRHKHTFGPAGMLEQDDGENWEQSTKGTAGLVAQRYPLHYGMQLGHGEVINDESGVPHVETNVNEHGQLWTYRAWAEWMAARDWDELRRNHSEVPRDLL
jgi:phenylpropionate dioxygenase-like ring-hydroxylating dioxygenase large terminal subunit